MKYVVLLRGINVGGKNKVNMTELRVFLEDLGFEGVVTYIQSGNVILESKKSSKSIANTIERGLPKKFRLDSDLIKIFVFSRRQFVSIADNAPQVFGKDLKKYHYDFIFLSGISSGEAAVEFEQNPDVDRIWTGPGVVYYRRLSAKRTKSRMSKIVGKSIYQNMTIRNWNTVNRLLDLLGDSVVQE